MKTPNPYAILGLKALKRAAIRAAENARKNNLRIPIWTNGRVEYLPQETGVEHGAPDDFADAPLRRPGRRSGSQ
jgi:hypothetical protein